MKFLFRSFVSFILIFLLFGCTTKRYATNEQYYEQPLHTMNILEESDKDSWKVDEYSEQQLASITPGERPPIDSDEAGLWMMMDKVEEDYKTSGKLIHDDKLNNYLKKIVSRLTPEYAEDIRIYVMRVPYFNAYIAPNGCMVVWSGLLLRAGNEAQVASVLGHEIAHYLRRHSLQQMRNARSTTSSLAFFRLATGIIGDVASLAFIGQLQSYSRDMEREADGYGIAMMTRAGYNPKESPRLWGQIIKEKKAAKDEAFSLLLFDSHPPTEERLKTLNTLAERILAEGKHFESGDQRYLEILAPFRFDFLRDELHLREFGRFEVLLNSLQEQHSAPGEIYYFLGEMYRLRGQEDDSEKAVAAYEKAVTEKVCPAEVFRSLGMLYLSQGKKENARRYFTEYLKRNPDSIDREIIMNML